MDYPNLFSPIDINSMTLRNRIVMTATHLGYTPEGEVTDRLIDFYTERAEGGAGLIVVGGCPIDECGSMKGMISINDDRFIPGLKRLTTAVKKPGAKIAAQLYQAGRYSHSSMTGGIQPVSASAVRSKLTGETPRALELAEIPSVQTSFAIAAHRAKNAGFDAVEILGSAGYLISQFFSPITNLREDEYGGSFENRMRFGLEVVDRVREAVGPDYPVLFRIAGNDFMKGGNTNKEAAMFAAELEKRGVDMFNVTGGWHETRIPQLTMFVPRKSFVYLAQGIKAAVTVPVLASNRINDPALGEEILRQGEADLVTMARGLLADPRLPQKAENGNPDQIYHCIACNQGCFDSIFRLMPVTCLVNPSAGKEKEFKITPAEEPKKILIIGGGPAGMKAACTAAERGHNVTLVEKSERLGGQLLLNRNIPGREEVATLAMDLENNLKALRVNVRKGFELDALFIDELQPDSILLATGAEPLIPQITGIDNPNVINAWEVLTGKAAVHEKVVIIGGNAVGLETALYLSHHGTITPEVLYFLAANKAESWETLEQLINKGNKKVVVLEMEKKAGKDIGASTRWTVMAELKRLGVEIRTGATATAITENRVSFEFEGYSQSIEADTVIIAAGSIPNNDLADKIQEMDYDFQLIGDAKTPRNALEAMKEGFLAGLKI